MGRPHLLVATESPEIGNVRERRQSSCLPFLRQCFVTASVCTNIVGHGTIIGFSAILIPSLRRPESHIKATVTQESSIASVVGIALILGNTVMTMLMGAQGRKVCHILNLLPCLVGWFVIMMADSVAALIVARFLQGISMGMMGPLGTVIIAEMTDPANRGAFLSTVSLSLSTGVFFSHTVGTYLSWQQTALVMSFVPFTSLILVSFAPESPSWLISKGRNEEASRIFYWLRGQSDKVEAELESIIAAQNMVKKSSITGQKVPLRVRIVRGLRYLSVTFRKPEFYKPVAIMVLMGLTLQFSGVNVINSYALDIIRQVIGPEANAKMLMVGIDILRLIFNLIAVFLMRKLNRRTVLFTSGISCVLCYFIKSGYVYAKMNGVLPAAISGQWFPTLILGSYVALSIGLSVIPFTMSGEIYPLENRGLAAGMSSIPWSLNFFIAVKCFPILILNIGLPLTYILYACVVVFCLVTLYFILPETKDRTLQEIENRFKGIHPADKGASMPMNPTEGVDFLRRNSSVVLY